VVDKENAKQQIKELVKQFFDIPEEERNKKPEEQIKFRFIEPLLEALGWKKQEIEKEPRVLKGRADYILRLENKNVLVIEAKRTGVSLTEEEGRQAVSYAYHQKIKFAVLTNFNEIRIYHALSNIKNITKNLLKDKIGYLWIKCENFEKQFDRLWLLSRESFEKEEINKLLSAKDERLSKPIDESILDDLLQFREWLSKDLKKLRTYLTKEQIDEVVQILIDRLIFMRSVEDRGLEEKDFLLKMVSDFQEGRTTRRIWESLLTEFRRFDTEYNSKLFQEGLLEKEAFFDEDTLIKFINGLYFGTKAQQEKYMFDSIPGDLLGDIYEQYLGTILSGTEKRVKLESETGKRKKMGIYYTPSYIVDYIVKNTVGEYIRGRSIDEILNVKILDPACGSGSFLIRAFREVCNVIESKLKNGEKSEKWATFKNYSGRLNLSQKTTILINCIFGVDLDEKAVELAQLNLLLKLLDDETRETKKLLLPNMKDNIKCGNSLIDDRKVAGDKAFNWHAQFPDIFRQGRFDVVIGNPPYGAKLNEQEREFISKKFDYSKSYKNTALVFIEKSLDLLEQDGYFGMIVPKSIAFSQLWEPGRELIKEPLVKVVDASKAFEDVLLEQVIIILNKAGGTKSYILQDITSGESITIDKKFVDSTDSIILHEEKKDFEIFKKMTKSPKYLSEITKTSRGLPFQRNLIKERTRYPVIKGKTISRYNSEFSDEYLPEKIVEQNRDKVRFLQKPKIISQRIVAHVTKPKEHIIIMSALDKNGLITIDTVENTIITDKNCTLEFLLCLLNSKLISWYAYRYVFSKAIRTMDLDDYYLGKIPLPGTKMDNSVFIDLANKMLELQKRYHNPKIAGHEKDQLKQQITNTDYEIDEEIYKLYGITEEEKKIIEDSLK
jgi:predicted type IV restriction endonuclease